MAREVSCSDLGVAGCNKTFRGETAADVVNQVKDHLESEHDIDLPQTEYILRDGIPIRTLLGEQIDEGARLIVDRLRDALDIRAEG
jgi:predicted small metal-binding protein